MLGSLRCGTCRHGASGHWDEEKQSDPIASSMGDIITTACI